MEPQPSELAQLASPKTAQRLQSCPDPKGHEKKTPVGLKNKLMKKEHGYLHPLRSVI